MKNKFVALTLIVVFCISTNSALAYNKDIANIKQSGTTVAMMKSSPAYKIGVAAAMLVKMNLMLLLAHNSRINHSMIVKKGTMLDFYQIRLTHNQSISNMAFLVVKRLWVFLIMLVTVLSIKQNLWQRLNVSMDITAANK